MRSNSLTKYLLTHKVWTTLHKIKKNNNKKIFCVKDVKKKVLNNIISFQANLIITFCFVNLSVPRSSNHDSISIHILLANSVIKCSLKCNFSGLMQRSCLKHTGIQPHYFLKNKTENTKKKKK